MKSGCRSWENRNKDKGGIHMTTIYLIRHAEAEGNYYRRIQGHWDGHITGLGMRQITALAERMKDIPTCPALRPPPRRF